MKKLGHVCVRTIFLFTFIAIIFCIPYIFCGCFEDNNYDGELLRLHIRANSNSSEDQAVKLKVRDAVNEYIEKNVRRSTFDEAYDEIGDRLGDITAIASKVLVQNGFAYGAAARLSYEYFPSRKYEDEVIPEGYYDALIIELGDAAGDNWWCVIYPPLCYGEQFAYKSIFVELFG